MRALATGLIVLAALLAACQQRPATLEASVVARYPHDTGAFTQGLVFRSGRFLESTGLYGESTLREVIVETGEVLRSVPLELQYFGEGLADLGDRLIQLTWRSGTALVWDADTFERVGTLSYDTEGWGLCYDGEHLYMSDGSSTLYRRDPATFAVQRRVQVTDRNEPVSRLNELECVGRHVYANVWQTDEIVKIDKGSGRVVATIDASGLLTEDERAGLSADAVLNGIAHDPDTGRFWLTGKLWPAVFEVEFVTGAAAD